MASGSSGQANASSKGFDFGSEDILFSYEDYGNQESSNERGDPAVGATLSKDFNKSRVTRSAVFPAAVNNQPEETLNQEVLSSVDRGLKKHTDIVVRILEGISSRLSQLEKYCYNLDKSVGEMRADLVRDHGEAELKLKSLEKHVQEVHRSVQILRDKQELAETQKELAKLQLVQKESTSSTHTQSNEQRALPQPSEPKKTENSSEATKQHLALALPHQVAPPQQSTPPPLPAAPQNVTQQQSYYVLPTQLSNAPTPAPAPAQLPQNYLPSNPQYGAPRLQEGAPVGPQSIYQPQVSQTPQFQQPFTQYQQQWAQQLPPQVQPPPQTLVRPQPPPLLYSSYPPSQPANPSTPETLANSMPMQVTFSSMPQPGSSRVDTMPYGYGGPSRPVPHQVQQQHPAQQMKGTFGGQVGDGYVNSGPHPGLSGGNAYMVYDNSGVRTHNPPPQPQYNPGGYPPASVSLPTAQPVTYPQTNVSLQNAQPVSGSHHMVRNPSHSQFGRNHPQSELIEKVANMGYRSDHVVGAIQRLEESGQPVDFNSVLDRLNGPSSAGPQRGW